jgi:hypothetical protein
LESKWRAGSSKRDLGEVLVGAGFLAPGRRGIRKGDLPRLTEPELFDHVVKTYVKKK